jgi:hypothetical protein
MESTEMNTPFPGMDPYLEHPVLWSGFHNALVVEIRRQLAPLLGERYVASVEERIVIESLPQHRVPDVWIQEVDRPRGGVATATEVETPLMLEVATTEYPELYLEILDLYQAERVVTVIELLSPTNKRVGPDRNAFHAKQSAITKSATHLVEIDLLRKGLRSPTVPERCWDALGQFDYVITANRANRRSWFAFYRSNLRGPLPRFGVPLVEPDPDVPLDLNQAIADVYRDSGYRRRVKYDEPCEPPLSPEDQEWAWERWRDYQQAHPEWFPSATVAGNGGPA